MEYHPHYLWPQGTLFNASEIASTAAAPIVKALTIRVPVASVIDVREKWVTGIGFERPKVLLASTGDHYPAIEFVLSNNYRIQVACNHDWTPVHYDLQKSNPARISLDGHAYCGKCNLWIDNFFMDQRLFDSMNLAYRCHDGQKRKFSNEDYIVHPEEVYNDVCLVAPSFNISTEDLIDLACASYLHDTLEDTDVTEKEIVAAAGEPVLNLVYQLTNPSKNFPELKRADRKKMDRDHLAHVSWQAKLIKLRDRICNVRDFVKQKDVVDEKFRKLYAQESRALLEILHGTQTGVGVKCHAKKVENGGV